MENTTTAEFKRMLAAGTKLKRFSSGDISPWTPVWSSAALEETVNDILSQPEGRLGDLFGGLWHVLQELRPPLTKPLANFVHDLVVLCSVSYRPMYEDERFESIIPHLQKDITPAQAYFALVALPRPLAIKYRESIFAKLAGTEFFVEATRML
jgi:hypothetical protein